MNGSGWVVGVDLAWGERRADGVCLLEVEGKRARVAGFVYPQGDAALLALLRERVGKGGRVLVAMDAPIVCPNWTGSRPVDRLTHRLFHREQAGCHPANRRLCPRPARVMERLAAQGYLADWDLAAGQHLVCEVYPHPAMVRWFGLKRILKYKRGPSVARQAEFARYQKLVQGLIRREFGELEVGADAEEVLRSKWSKPAEDRMDALFCALLGWWHLKHDGVRSEVIGDRETGFILLPSLGGAGGAA